MRWSRGKKTNKRKKKRMEEWKEGWNEEGLNYSKNQERKMDENRL
jgi:hypothetical protein